MGMKLKSGADLCGFQLTNFCVQGEASAPSDAALGRKYFHTNATDDVATGISLLHRERIYLGEGAWRATAYLDDIAAIQTKLDMILGDVDLDGVIENMNEVIKFLENNKDTENLMTLLDDKLSKSKGGIMTGELCVQSNSTDASAYIAFKRGTDAKAYLLYSGGDDFNFYSEGWGRKYTFIHSGNIESYAPIYNASGNILIGTTTDDGNKLQVIGGASFRSATNWQNERTVLNYAGLKLYARDTGGYNQSISFLNYDGTIFAGLFAHDRRSLVVGTGEYDPWVTFAPDGVHIVGNLIVDGEISAGGAGAEEGTSGSGSAEGVSEIFTPTSTSMAFDHNLGEDVIVQVYEKSGNVWNMVMVDTEITSATRVTLRFGKTETTQHKVVIMGV